MSVCAVVAAAVPVHEEMSWLNEDAPLNIYPILTTCAVFQLPMSWLNAEADSNIAPISVTFSVFQLPMFWLNEDALLNIYPIVFTDDVSHFEISPLNVLLPPKPVKAFPSDPLISVTKLVFQFGIVP
jgi:hypothetical protein